MHEKIVVVHRIAVFSAGCGVRWRHSRPPNSELHVYIVL